VIEEKECWVFCYQAVILYVCIGFLGASEVVCNFNLWFKGHKVVCSISHKFGANDIRGTVILCNHEKHFVMLRLRNCSYVEQNTKKMLSLDLFMYFYMK
jgi:hypothetical protein